MARTGSRAFLCCWSFHRRGVCSRRVRTNDDRGSTTTGGCNSELLDGHQREKKGLPILHSKPKQLNMCGGHLGYKPQRELPPARSNPARVQTVGGEESEERAYQTYENGSMEELLAHQQVQDQITLCSLQALTLQARTGNAAPNCNDGYGRCR